MLLALRRALAVMNYDNMTCAPKNSAPGYAQTVSVLSGDAHRLTFGEERGRLLELLKAESCELDELTQKEVAHALEERRESGSVPPEEFSAFRRVTGEAYSAWISAKARSDHSAFEPHLDAVFSGARRIAAFAAPDKDPFDYWLDKFEKGSSQEYLDGFFEKLRECIVPLLRRVLEKPPHDTSCLHGSFPIALQRRFSDAIMELMGIDRKSCSIAEVEHPYTMGINNRDVRITTHYYEDFVTANMFSVLHEGGHALYELGISDELSGSPLSAPASSGIHESQSRFYENVIGRSRAFAELIMSYLREYFPGRFEKVSDEEFYLAVNSVSPTLKRTESDELTYCLHIMIRYELEKKLLHGELSAHDIPAEWNRLYKEYLGLSVPSDREGCLQDMHWGSGLIGYFPTYALGNAYAAQINAVMRRELETDALIRGGRIPEITAWLRSHIHQYGKTKTPAELIKTSCGEEFDPQYYIDYLTEKFTKLYNL